MKSLALACSMLVLAASARTAVADPSPDAPRPRKSPAVATLAALAPAVAGSALIASTLVVDDQSLETPLLAAGATALTIGPSFGHLYVGAPGRGLVGVGVRAAGVGLVCAALFVPWSDDDGERGIDLLIRLPMLLGGATLVAGGTIGSVVDAAPAARRYNQVISVAPTVLPSAAGPTPGLVLGGVF